MIRAIVGEGECFEKDVTLFEQHLNCFDSMA